jgi:mono/diheme cytochrome c family protein
MSFMNTSEKDIAGLLGREFGSDRQHVKTSGQGRLGFFRLPPAAFCLLIILFSVFGSSCRMDMQDQPKDKAYRADSFFSDDSSMRRPPEGTVARGFLQEDTLLFTGKAPGAGNLAQGGNVVPATSAANQLVDSTVFPFPITQDVMDRGKGRYEIYCSVCHGMTGHGDGMIIRRGFNRKPPTFNDARLLTAPVGHYFDVISNGWGAMPSYSQQIPVTDRWSIIAYIRALQRSQTGFTGSGTTSAANSNSNANANAAGNSNANNATPQPAGNRVQNQAGGRR